MKKSKNLGFCKACPSCRKTLLKNANIKGIGKFDTRCPHCKALIEVDITQKSCITLKAVV